MNSTQSVQVFLKPLQEKEILSKQQLVTIFQNVEILLNFHSTLYKDLSERMKTWTPRKEIADIFITMVPFMKMYTQYVSNFDDSRKELTELREHKAFTEFLEVTQNFLIVILKIF